MFRHGALIRFGEVFLKGRQRDRFIAHLTGTVQAALADLEGVSVTAPRGRILVRFPAFVMAEGREREVYRRLARLPGIASFSPVQFCDRDLATVDQALAEMAREVQGLWGSEGTFRIHTNRSDKRVGESSQLFNVRFAEVVTRHLDRWRVSLHNPDVSFGVELHADYFLVFREVVAGQGGLPCGVSGSGVLLLSGGLDSPVAGWMAVQRGLVLHGLHIYAAPHTPHEAREKAAHLASCVTPPGQKMKFFLSDLGPFQRHCLEKAPRNLLVLLYRRQMVRLASRLAFQERAGCIVTGESLGQVASQTLANLGAIEEASNVPILRPLIGLDKESVVDRARQIGTYDTSILPFPDACSRFVPKHPETNGKLDVIHNVEQYLAWEDYLQEALDSLEYRVLAG